MSAKGLQSDSSESKHFARIIVLNTLYQVQDSYILTIWQENDVWIVKGYFSYKARKQSSTLVGTLVSPT